jgi:hypothetical protein
MTTTALVADMNNPGRSHVLISLASTPAQTQNLVFYQISNTQFLAVELDSSQFGAGILKQQQYPFDLKINFNRYFLSLRK